MGQPYFMIKIPLKGGLFVLIDDDDYDLVSGYKWGIQKSNCNNIYAVNYSAGLMHRLIMNANKNQIIDHIDNNGLNNQRCNLRLCSHSQNMRNRKPSVHSSKYLGVSWNKYHEAWDVRITSNHKKIYLGKYRDEKEAAKAYNDAAKKYHGEFASLNKL